MDADVLKPKRLTLSKPQRAHLAAMFDGLCAYCGHPLGEKWHADHIEPIGRNLKWVKGKGFMPTGTYLYPGRDFVGNLFPACVACNIDKGPMALETWRQILQRRCEVLERNSSTYRFARRFGLIVETGALIEFHFEKVQRTASLSTTTTHTGE